MVWKYVYEILNIDDFEDILKSNELTDTFYNCATKRQFRKQSDDIEDDAKPFLTTILTPIREKSPLRDFTSSTSMIIKEQSLKSGFSAKMFSISEFVRFVFVIREGGQNIIWIIKWVKVKLFQA